MSTPDLPSSAPTRRSVPVGWVVLVVVGALISLSALLPVAGGGFLVWANATQRDDSGYFTTRTERLETTSYAITSQKIDLGARPTDQQTKVEFSGRSPHSGSMSRARERPPPSSASAPSRMSTGT